jgi:hypothetical protein
MIFSLGFAGEYSNLEVDGEVEIEPPPESGLLEFALGDGGLSMR